MRYEVILTAQDVYEVEAPRGGTGDIHAEVSIWDAERNKSYRGPTPQAALECLLNDYGVLSEVPETVILPTLSGDNDLVAAVAVWDGARLGVQDPVGDRSEGERTKAHLVLQAAELGLIRAFKPFRGQ